MVKKLLKHEFMYYFRTLGMFLPLILIIGGVTRLFVFLDELTDGSVVTTIALSSSILMQYVGSFVMLLAPMVICVIRFYKNMYSSGGYLTLTLPVTYPQHILVKLIVNAVFEIISFILVISALLIAVSGAEFTEIFIEAIRDIIVLFSAVPTVHVVFFIIEFVLMMVLALFACPLLYFACITIGQTAKKNRIVMSVVTYLVYYIIVQVLMTIAVIVFMVLLLSGSLDNVFENIANNPFTWAHCGMCVGLIGSAALSWLYYYVTVRIMTKKLNLE